MCLDNYEQCCASDQRSGKQAEHVVKGSILLQLAKHVLLPPPSRNHQLSVAGENV
jgi:hypothetical protein